MSPNYDFKGLYSTKWNDFKILLVINYNFWVVVSPENSTQCQTEKVAHDGRLA